jgi:hypothetical protein
MHTLTDTFTQIHTHSLTHAHTLTHSHTRTHTHAHTHTPSRSAPSSNWMKPAMNDRTTASLRSVLPRPLPATELTSKDMIAVGPSVTSLALLRLERVGEEL